MTTMRKLAVVTGAASGLGLEFSKLLAKDSYDLGKKVLEIGCGNGTQVMYISKKCSANYPNCA